MSEDELKQRKALLDPNARVILGRQLRDYYDRMRQTAVSDSLAQLLRQFEASATQVNERQNSPQADPTQQNQ